MRRACPIVVAVLALAGRAAAQPAPQDDPLAKDIRAATAKATAALAKAVTPPPEDGALPRAVTFALSPQVRPLVALALLRAGGADERKVARRLLDDWWRDNVERESGTCSNYELALAISAHEGLTVERIEDAHPTTVTRYEAKPIADDVKERLALLTRTLIASRHAGANGKGCAWAYDVVPWVRNEAKTKERARPRSGERPPGRNERPFDNSNTQFSVLALHDAQRGGVAIPAAVARAVADHFLACMTRAAPAGGTGRDTARWGYVLRGVQPSMTFAGLSSLGIARDLGCHEAAIDAAIEDGLRGLGAIIAQVPPPAASGGFGFGSAYDLYSLEKALDTLDVRGVDGKDWFAPLARKVLDVQGGSGLWGGGDLADSSLYVLFLTRATVSRARLIDARSTGPGQADPLGEVYIACSKRTVDAIALLRAYADATGSAIPKAKTAAEEAVLALLKEAHGREACILEELAALIRKGGDRKDTGLRWTRDACGRAVALDQLDAWGATVKRLARERAPDKLREALGEKAPLPVRAWAASELAKLQAFDAASEVLAAGDALALETALETQAGARCARSFADALTGLLNAALPALPQTGAVSRKDLEALLDAGREKARKALDERLDGALAAYEKRDPAWPKLREQLSGKRALRRMVERRSFRLLRAVTGELIPDEPEVWKKFIGE